MSRIRSKNTKPELILRKFLHKSGYRYRVNLSILGKPDIVFTKKKIAVFVHGCFWHRHGCKNSVMPKTNTEFWEKKLNQNVKRDKEVKNLLAKEGWKQLIVWECELENLKKSEKEILENLGKVKNGN